MYLFLLKKALPFTLTFILGAALSAVIGLFGASEKKTETFFGSRSCDYSKRSRMRRHHLVAETKPLRILNVPDALWPSDFKPDSSWPGEREASYWFPGATVSVTFGADGKVQRVEPSDAPYPSLGTRGDKVVWECMANAARQIRFEPETVDGRPVTVTRDVEIRFGNRAGQR